MGFRLASLFIAAVIGAGFSSGQEILQFFVAYQQGGLYGIVVATILLAIGGNYILCFCYRNRITTYSRLLQTIGGQFSPMLDVAYTCFLIAGVSIMLAGSQELLSPIIPGGRYLTAALVYIALNKGIGKVLSISAVAMPMLFVLMTLVSLKSLARTGICLPDVVLIEGVGSGLLYASYNLGFAMAVFAGVSSEITSKRQATIGALFGAGGLGLLVALQALALMGFSSARGSIPMLELAFAAQQYLGVVYGMVLWIAMYTTALANGLALATRVKEQSSLGWAASCLSILVISLVFSYFGFVPLIKTAYPLFGYIGLYLLYRILLYSQDQ